MNVDRTVSALCLSLIVICTALAPARPLHAQSSPTCPGSRSSCTHALLTLLNSERARLHLPALTLSSTQSRGTGSCAGSYGHSLAMAGTGGIWHNSTSKPAASFPKNICVPYGRVGENVGEASTGDEMQDVLMLQGAMMGEPHSRHICASTVNHACNILNVAFRHVGIGLYNVAGTTWLTEDFTD